MNSHWYGSIEVFQTGCPHDNFGISIWKRLSGIMNGNAWVMSMRAFCMVTAALLQQFISNGGKTFLEISDYIDDARHHSTGRHWVDNFIKPMLLAHQFLCAEREGDWLFQQLWLERMLHYFFIAEHIHYARYLTLHLTEMRNIPEDVKKYLIAGAHVCGHKEGSWNAVSSDHFG